MGSEMQPRVDVIQRTLSYRFLFFNNRTVTNGIASLSHTLNAIGPLLSHRTSTYVSINLVDILIFSLEILFPAQCRVQESILLLLL